MFMMRVPSVALIGWCPSYHHTSYYNSSSVCLFVCLCVCSLSPPRSFDGSSPNLVAVCRWTSHLPLRGSFSKRSTGRWVNGSLSLSTILYMRQPHATRCISTAYVGGPRNCYWGVLFRKGQRVDGSNGSTGHFHFHCVIYDSRRRQPHATLLQKAHGVNGSTGQRVHGSTGHFHFHYIIYDSRRRQAHATPLQKAHGVWWHQAHATPLQKAHSVFCSLDE